MKIKILLTLILVAITLASCQQAITPAPSINVSPTLTAEQKKLTIGVMPAVDAAPIFLAKDKGYYSALGLDVTIKVFTNATDRQSALQTNTIDGAMSDMIALITNVQGGFDIKGTTLTDGVFPVLIKKNFVEKKNIKVAMMEVSVSNYLSDEWLGTDHTIEKVFINEIPSRLEMIKAGKVDMGIFPEPMATMGSTDGIVKKIYDIKDGYCPDILVFTGRALSTKSMAIGYFHRAYDRAVADIQKDASLARNTLITNLNLSPAIKDNITLPEYHLSRLPDTYYTMSIKQWISSVLKKPVDISEADIFNLNYIHK
jgi:NitT/TauT family transport system substrate-binding protein